MGTLESARAADLMRALQSYSYSILSSGATLVIGVLTGTLVNRFLGPLDRGELASMTFVATTASALVAAVVSPQAIVRHMNQSNDAHGIGAAVSVTVLLACASFPVSAVLLILFHQQASTALAVASVLILSTAAVQTLHNGLCAVQRALFNFKLVALTVVLVPSCYALLLLLGLALGRLNATTAMLASMLPVLASVALLVWRLRATAAGASAGWAGTWQCIRRGVEFLPVTIGSLALASADRALVLKLADLEALGYFAAAAGLSSPIAVAAEAIVQVSFVEISRTQGDQARSLAMERFRVGQIALLLFGIGAACIGPWFLVTASGPAFAAAVPVLLWLIAAAVVRGAVTMLDTSLRALGLLSYSFASLIVGVTVMAVSGFLLVPRNAAVGAAQAVLIAYVAMLIMHLAIWHWRVGVRWAEFWAFRSSTFRRVRRLLEPARRGTS